LELKWNTNHNINAPRVKYAHKAKDISQEGSGRNKMLSGAYACELRRVNGFHGGDGRSERAIGVLLASHEMYMADPSLSRLSRPASKIAVHIIVVAAVGSVESKSAGQAVFLRIAVTASINASMLA